MRQLSILIFTTCFAHCFGQTSADNFLFKITENGKTGYIDTSGKVVISPIFQSSGEFSESLASARINGKYGYINEKGNFTIQPQFDYALPFNEGMAIVYNNERPFFINKKGQKAFECNFPIVSQFENGRALVKTASKKYGIINLHGELFVDTIFEMINPFVNGLAVVQGINHHSYSDHKKGIKTNYEIGVIDSLGKFVIPYGRYKQIHDYDDGYFKIELPCEPWDTIQCNTGQIGFIDKNGNLIFSRDCLNKCWITGNIHCGLAKIDLYKNCVPEKKGVVQIGGNSHEGFVDLRGEIVINDTTYDSVKDFSNNRAFVRDKKRWKYFVINTKGKQISNDKYTSIVGDGFKNGVAFVEKDGKYGMVDTNANFIISPQFEGIHEAGIVNGYFFFYDWNNDRSTGHGKVYGIAKADGSILLKPIIQDFNIQGFQNGVLRCSIQNKLAFVNKQGKIIWQAPEDSYKKLISLNIDYMNRGYFYAHSKPNKKDIGGFGGSRNYSKKVSKKYVFKPDVLSVLVQTDIMDTVFDDYKGAPVFIVNATNKKVRFNAQDSRLYMKVQAQNTNGEWKDIEYLQGSWCGNSYHTLTLEPKHFWPFSTPMYEGELKTKLRIELKYIDPKYKFKNKSDDDDEAEEELNEITIYSNEYEGSINPGQFWRKEGYYSKGLMDPYDFW